MTATMLTASTDELLDMPETQLRAINLRLDVAAAAAAEEIKTLENAPIKISQRLEALEKYFSDLRQEDVVYIKNPELHAAAQELKEAQQSRPAKAIVVPRPHLKLDAEGELGPLATGGRVVAHAEHKNFALGAGYVPLDRNMLDYTQLCQQKSWQNHPAVERLHYRGDLPRSSELDLSPVYDEDTWHGRLERLFHEIAFGPSANQGGDSDLDVSSLSLLGKLTDPHVEPNQLWPDSPPQVQNHFHRSPVLETLGAEETAVDWLGLKRRGAPIDEDWALTGPCA